MEEVTGEVSFAGKTDPQIAYELLALTGMSRAAVDERLATLWPIYLDNLRREIREIEVQVLPGIRPLLTALEEDRDDTVLGLLTGNVREGAQIKLAAANIGFERFRVGAYGSDHAERPELPAVAVRRAEAATGHHFRGKEVVVIGDTPNDIACGEALGVRTVAVATGSYTRHQLGECGPDHVFDSLQDLDAVRAAIRGE